jgi:hypothetical protein
VLFAGGGDRQQACDEAVPAAHCVPKLPLRHRTVGCRARSATLLVGSPPRRGQRSTARLTTWSAPGPPPRLRGPGHAVQLDGLPFGHGAVAPRVRPRHPQCFQPAGIKGISPRSAHRGHRCSLLATGHGGVREVLSSVAVPAASHGPSATVPPAWAACSRSYCGQNPSPSRTRRRRVSASTSVIGTPHSRVTAPHFRRVRASSAAHSSLRRRRSLTRAMRAPVPRRTGCRPALLRAR